MKNTLRKQGNSNLVILLVIFVVSSCVYADERVASITDGLSHEISNDTYKDKIVQLDYEVDNIPGTHVDLLEGALLDTLYAWGNSSVTMFEGSAIGVCGFDNSVISIAGGDVTDGLGAYGNSNITMSDGLVASAAVAGNSLSTINGGLIGYNGIDFRASENSTVNISGGIFGGRITVLHDAVATISGGIIPALRTRHNGIIWLEGTGFEVNGVPLKNGDRLSEFGTLVELRSDGDIRDYYKGQISGYLADGSALDIPYLVFNKGFYEGTGDIIIVPEPASLLLIGFGGLILRKFNNHL